MICLEWKWSSKHICTKCGSRIVFIWLFLGPRRSWDSFHWSWMNLASNVNEKSWKWSKSHDVKKYDFCHFKENQMKNWKYHICALPSKSSNFNKKLWKWPKSHTNYCLKTIEMVGKSGTFIPLIKIGLQSANQAPNFGWVGMLC